MCEPPMWLSAEPTCESMVGVGELRSPDLVGDTLPSRGRMEIACDWLRQVSSASPPRPPTPSTPTATISLRLRT
eukprot:COSAG01_NODE_4282_length_5176_cov_3.204058_3_plen_74_part_00